MGHGAQKLFGWFGGYGPAGTAAWLESIGLRPGRPWATLAGASEFGGGALIAAGLGGPLGPVAATGAMAMASVTVHAGKPIWVSAGGAELPVTNMAVQTALILAGPGRLSLDSLLRLKISRWLAVPALAVVVGAVLFGRSQAADVPAAVEEVVIDELQSGDQESQAEIVEQELVSAPS
jgi:putative oxidoreductase